MKITAKAHADASKQSTLQVNVVDWILADYDADLINGEGGSYGSRLPLTGSYEECSWAFDHLKFICIDGASQAQTAFQIFETDGSTTGTKQIATVDLSWVQGLVSAGYPRFSPDGTKIVFSGSEMSGMSLEEGPFIVDAAGKTAPVLVVSDPTLFDTTFSSPRFTPDGNEVIYAQSSGLWIVDSDGSNPRKLADAPASQGGFSPDMSALYYASGGCIYMADVDGSNPVCVFSGNVDRLMDVSPNGQYLLYAALQSVSPTGGNVCIVGAMKQPSADERPGLCELVASFAGGALPLFRPAQYNWANFDCERFEG